MDKGEGGEMKSQDYIGRYLPDKHYRKEPPSKEKVKCFYCGSIFEIDEECPNGCVIQTEE